MIMETIKACTTIEQSRKLAKILPLESADMFYVAGKGEPIFIGNKIVAYGNDNYDALGGPDVLCWSLSALLDVLPNGNMLVKTTEGGYYCLSKYSMTKHYDNPIDACYEMVLKLHELNLL